MIRFDHAAWNAERAKAVAHPVGAALLAAGFVPTPDAGGGTWRHPSGPFLLWHPAREGDLDVWTDVVDLGVYEDVPDGSGRVDHLATVAIHPVASLAARLRGLYGLDAPAVPSFARRREHPAARRIRGR